MRWNAVERLLTQTNFCGIDNCAHWFGPLIEMLM
jgi:hypothetical protein